MSAEFREPIKPRVIAEQISQFISDNQHSNDPQMRWLASEMRSTVVFLGEVISQRGLGPELRAKFNDFRRAELLAEVESKQKDIIRLDREIKQLA